MVTIGNNVVISAGSTVTKNIPSNCVAEGSLVKVISILDNYLEKIERDIIHTGGLSISDKKKILIKKFK